ncbi:cation-translocating P-type ATPase [Magnetospirillum sp. 64-120]|uniref:heavy metal translocating P-type ATPase n=1 Tax=Magnetospirillum sp. 64-120 TaxID=1895778 RepID=UPI0009284183|nr:cation-translocating P-type ATPase [Magnetospirillum sp. 64-120]OJX68624.1 MAG: cadmium-translocating P-type ATPase [Magnetospirillum sp. 64-120]
MNAPLEQTSRLDVTGMDCGSCVAKIETALTRQPGVRRVQVSMAEGVVEIGHDDGVDPQALGRLLSGLGYRTKVVSPPMAAPSCGCGGCHAPAPASVPDRTPPWWRDKLGLLALCGVLLAVGQAALWLVPGTPEAVILPALAVGGLPVLRRAVNAARLGSPFSMEMLMSVAVAGALVVGAWDEAAMVVFLFGLGEALEGLAARKARAGIMALAQLLPKQVLRRQGDAWVETAATEVRVGDFLLLRPGDRLAVDGVVEDGEAGMDEAAVSGESRAVRRQPGDPVPAGAIALDGVLTIRATSDAADNTVTRIARLVERAQAAKSPFARFIDRFARWYTPAVVGAAALVMVLPPLVAGQDWGVWFYRGLALLLIGCPCALVISTPAALAASLAAGARRGILFKGGDVVERLAKVDLVGFDKTGTLTEGRPLVVRMAALSDDGRPWEAVAAGLCQGSSHPLARAIADYLQAGDGGTQEVTRAHAVPGRGIGGDWHGVSVFLGVVPMDGVVAEWQAQGKTVSVLTADQVPVLAFALEDGLRPDSKAAVARLRGLGLRLAILSGDHAAAARKVGDDLAMDVQAPLLPEAKMAAIRQWQQDGLVVAKVGDGINDAPALAAADVGIAMGGGSEIALETADCGLLGNRLGDVAAAVEAARRTMRVIRQNVFMALGLKGFFLVTTVVGLTGLWPAVLADTGATVLVTLNALRLLKLGHAQGGQAPSPSRP